MYKSYRLFVGIFVLLMCGCVSSQTDEKDNTIQLQIKIGDPYILASSNGKYYMYGTSLKDGFEAYSSSDMINWEPCGQVYKGGQEDQWNVSCFWAPEVYERDGRYYMFYSANDKDNPTCEEENFRIGVAVANNPDGPFTDLYDRPIFKSKYPVIDANVLFDEDGRCYLYFSRCCYKHPVSSEIADKAIADGICQEVEESWIYGAELAPDFSMLLSDPVLLLVPPTKLSDRQAEWESRSLTQGEANRRWTEGSFAFKHNGTYYIMYSANFFGGANYAVGYATSQSPLGPFEKSDLNPILQENVSAGGNIMGTGHNMVFNNPADGAMYCVYHGRTVQNPTDRIVFISPMVVDSDGHIRIQYQH